jgi:hypothetical protein
LIVFVKNDTIHLHFREIIKNKIEIEIKKKGKKNETINKIIVKTNNIDRSSFANFWCWHG